MKFEKVIIVNLSNGESVKLGVSDADSFIECDRRLSVELQVLGLKHKAVNY